MKKKVICVTLAAALMFGAMPAYAATDNAVKVVVDNKELTATGVIIDGRTLIPLRALGEALGATVNWDAAKQEIRIEKMLYQSSSKGIVTDSNRVIIMHIGNKEILKNGTAEQLDVAPQMINGSTMVPVKAVTSFLEASTTWDSTSRTVKVSSSWNTTPEGAIQGEQNKQIEFGNALGNRIAEINRQDAIEREKEEKEYIAENKPKGDLKAWGYSYSFDTRNMGPYGSYIEFRIFPGGYQTTKTNDDVESEWFWLEVINNKTQEVEYKTTFIYNEVKDANGLKQIVFPKNEYADENKFTCQFKVVMDRNEADRYKKSELAENEAIKQKGKLEDWGYEVEILEIYNLRVGGESLEWIKFQMSTNPLTYTGDLNAKSFKLSVIDKSTKSTVYEKQFTYRETHIGERVCKLKLPSTYLDEDKYDYEFSVVV